MRTVIAVLLAGLVLCPLASAADNPAPQYKVYAIRYAEVPDFPVAALIAGADHSRKMDIAMIVWLVQAPGRNILVDTGFYREHFFKSWKVRNFIKPSDVIAKLGLKPEDITDVIVTHMHWDHADGADLFPQAKFWIQNDEYTYYTGEAWQSPKTHGGIDPDDVLAMVKLNLAGRVAFVNGDDQEILPGIHCYTGGKHTYASQYVSVPTAAGTVVLASDNVYLYENLDTHKPISQTLDPASNLAAQERMKRIASDPRLIVPGHDPAEFTRFPKPGDGVAEMQ